MPETPHDVAAAPADAETTASGLASKLLEYGSGENPGAGYPAGTLVFDVELIKIGR